MKVHLHQTNQTIADFKEIQDYLRTTFNNAESGIHIFPESFLCGYPLQDLCLKNSFITNYQENLKEISDFSKSLPVNKNLLFLVGGIKYTLTPEGLPEKLENVIYSLSPGKPLEDIYTKILLPNYDIFDEKKYYHPGQKVKTLNFNGKHIALMVCEDMWPNTGYSIDPTKELKQLDQDFDLVINLSASPYNLKKQEKRLHRATEISNYLNAPFFYVNRVGGEDEILFDGRSFAVNGDQILFELKSFEPDHISFDIPETKPHKDDFEFTSGKVTTWESLFVPNIIEEKNKYPILAPLSNDECEEIIKALAFGIQEYAGKCYQKNFVIALSGGMDSCLVLTILKLFLKEGQTLEAIYMPSKFSADLSYNISKQLCENLNIPLHVLPIKGLHDSSKELFKAQIGHDLLELADENIQSRLRSTLLLARTNQLNAIAINTSNKSELSVGYSTIYGDSVGAISMLGDIYKSEVYMLAKYINKTRNNIIPEDVITRPPSAELREDQIDTDSLPPYEVLDVILEGILSYRLTAKQMIQMGLPQENVERVFRLYKNSEFKRSQFCPIVKIKAKSFGFGYRVPICKDSNYYLET